MSYHVITKLLGQRLNTVSASVPTAWENMNFTPPANGGAWQQAFLLPAQTENPTMGDGFRREVGIFQVTSFRRAGEGTAASHDRAEAIKDAFPRGLVLQEGKVRVWIDRDPWIAAGRNEAGYFQQPVSIPYIGDIYP